MSGGRWRAAVAALTCAWAVGAAAAEPAPVRLVASDLLGEEVAQAWQTQLAASGRSVTVALTGSRRGWTELQAGTAQVGLMMFSPTEKAPAAPFFAVPVAYHVVHVQVPRDLPLTQLTLGQLASIFGSGKSPPQRWGDVGVAGPGQSRAIAPRVLAPARSLTATLFRHVVLKDGAFAASVRVLADAGDLPGTIPNEAGAVLLTAQPLAPAAGYKTVAIARDASAGAVQPSPEDVHRGDYVLRWPVQLVVRRAEAQALLPVLRELLGEDGAERLAQAQLVAAPAAARASLTFQLETMEK